MSRRSTPGQHPTVSVIIPVHNGSVHIAAAIGSVLAQTSPASELILIDDGSSDDSVAKIEAVIGAAADTLVVKVLQQQQQGQSAARNVAAGHATGELLAFLDQDDLWHPRHLEKLLRPFAARSEIGWTYSDFDEIDGGGSLITEGFIRTHGLEHPKRTLTQYLKGDLMMLPSAAMIRASAFAEVGGFDPQLCGYEDDDLFIRLFRAGWRTRYVDEPLTRFRVHGTSASASDRFRTSRMVFLAKLEREVVDDTRLNRYYIRDLVFPRLFQATVSDYATALRTGNDEEARRIAIVIGDLQRRSPGSWKRKVEASLMANPRMMRRVLVVHGRLPRRVRPSINPALLAGVTPRRP